MSLSIARARICNVSALHIKRIPGRVRLVVRLSESRASVTNPCGILPAHVLALPSPSPPSPPPPNSCTASYLPLPHPHQSQASRKRVVRPVIPKVWCICPATLSNVWSAWNPSPGVQSGGRRHDEPSGFWSEPCHHAVYGRGVGRGAFPLPSVYSVRDLTPLGIKTRHVTCGLGVAAHALHPCPTIPARHMKTHRHCLCRYPWSLMSLRT